MARLIFRYKTYFFSFLIAISTQSCFLLENEITNGNINSKIKVTLRHQLSEDETKLTLLSETENIEPCFNFVIKTHESKQGNKISIKYLDILRSDFCLTALGPARSAFTFKPVLDVYDIEFVNDGIRNEGQLKNLEDRFVLELANSQNVHITNSPLFKIPSYTYWGNVGYHRTESKDLVDEFISLLENQGADFRTFQDGNYGYFEIDGGEVIPPNPHGYHFIETFVFIFEGNEDAFRDKILEFAEKHREDLNINLANYKGSQISLWANN
jgi:hypothetical protein